MTTLAEVLTDSLSEAAPTPGQTDLLTRTASASSSVVVDEIETEPKKNSVKFNEFVEKIEVVVDEEEEVVVETITV